MPLSIGDKIGPYEILAPIGAGGMGQVWKARDTRLNRFVAIKTSQKIFSARFEREAHATAALNHPHICSLYDVGPDYLVMEYIEGVQLPRPVPLDQALMLADQILDALDAAHRRGITHRDLKPANILLGPHGVKVLDFGLAKIEHGLASDGSATQAATETAPLTAEGSVLGTLQYMSPEQLEGQGADARSDLFAFGVVLYELIAGKRPFHGKSQTSLIASILKEEPRPLSELQPVTPSSLDAVVRTCLEKDPEKRWQSAREVRHALKWVAAEKPPRRTASTSVRVWQGAAAILGLAVLAVAGWAFWPKALGSTMRLEASLPENVTLNDFVSVSPDGRKIVISPTARDALRIRDLDSTSWRRLAGTEDGWSPFWSPDSRFLAFAVGNQIKKLDLAGGPPETLCTVSSDAGGSGTWNRNGTILFGSWGGGAGGPLWKVSQTGGSATAITEVDTSKGELYHTWPVFLPDGKHFVYFRSGTPDTEGIYVGSLDAQPAGQSRQRILATESVASYANGYLLFQRSNTLMAQAFDASRLQLRGDPVPIAEAVESTWFGTGVFSVSPAGVLAYHPVTLGGNIQLTWFDRQGKAAGVVGQPSGDNELSISPEGTRAVVKDAAYDRRGDLWTVDLSTGSRTRLTFRKDVFSPGVWSPDGGRIAFVAGNFGDTLYEKASSGGGDEKELFKEPGIRHYVTSWSRDGRFLLYHTENAPKTGYDVWALPLEANRKPVLLLGEQFNEWAAVFSPDMHWIAYASTETRPADVFVRPFKVSEAGVPGLGEGKWQVSKDGGNWPRWRTQNEIAFLSDFVERAKVVAAVHTQGSEFGRDVPKLLFTGPLDTGFDVTPDGQRFLLAVRQIQRAAPDPLTIVLNWPALLKK
jgi:eukaryotic-like serine/threonine-protein kinase